MTHRGISFARGALLALLAPSLALAQVPAKVGYQGRLLKADGSPESGVVQVKLALFAAASGGSELWSEQQSLALSDGYYATRLGETAALPAGLFDGKELFLELTVGGNALSPRHQVGSVPYALTAGTARDVVGGKVEASSVWVGGKEVISSSGKLGGGAEYAAATGGGLELAGNAFGMLKSCNNGQILKWNGTAWACADDSAGMGGIAVAAPMIGSGSTSSPITLPAANGSTAGYLTAADWTTFNGKVDGSDPRLTDAREPKAGGANYIQNQFSADQAASLRIKGSAAVVGRVGVNKTDAAAPLHVAGVATAAATGVASSSAGSSTLSGVGTKFASEIAVGDVIATTGSCTGTGQSSVVTAVGSDTALTVADAWAANVINCGVSITKPVARFDKPGGQVAAFIDPLGRMGVGTDRPLTTLDVAGPARVRGFSLELQGADFILGSADGRAAGTKKNQRALVHNDADVLYVNYDGDFEGGTVIQGPSVAIAGNLAVGGTYHGGSVLNGYLQPPTWSYSATSGETASTWKTLWTGNVSVARKSLLQYTLQGHWQTTNGYWCYATVMVNGSPAAANCNSSTNSSCWGAAHTYSSTWENLVVTGYATVEPGTVTLGPGVVTTNSCGLNGARIQYALIPL